ncbi:MAG: hypothetical protein AAF518_10890 [Spirochaetota bacterium]
MKVLSADFMIGKTGIFMLLLLFFVPIFAEDSSQGVPKQKVGVFLTISQSQKLATAKPLLVDLQDTLTTILSGQFSAFPATVEVLLPAENIPWQGNTLFSAYHYGISVQTCLQGIALEERNKLLQCLPRKEETFFTEAKVKRFLMEMELLRQYKEGSAYYWIDVQEATPSPLEIPPHILEEWNILHQSVSIGKAELKLLLGKKISITLRRLHGDPYRVYELEYGGTGKVLFQKQTLSDGFVNLSSQALSLQQKVKGNFQLRKVSLIIKTLNDKALYMHAKIPIGEDMVFTAKVNKNEIELLEKSGYLSIQYLQDNERRLQVIRDIRYQISLDRSLDTNENNYFLYLLGTVVFLILVLFYGNRILRSKNDKKAIGIKMYTIDTSSIQPKHFKIQEKQRVGFAHSTYSEAKCAILYNIGMEGHYLELVSARSFRFSYINLHDPSKSRELVLPADIELRDSKGRLIRVSLEVMDSRNSFMMKV